MNYYKDALYTLEHITEVPSIFIHETVKDLAEVFKELVDKEEEMQSRKDKLVVGSEWVCVADCYHFNGLITNGEIFTLKRVNKMRVTISSLDCETYVMYEQFLLCFKPKGE